MSPFESWSIWWCMSVLRLPDLPSEFWHLEFRRKLLYLLLVWWCRFGLNSLSINSNVGWNLSTAELDRHSIVVHWSSEKQWFKSDQRSIPTIRVIQNNWLRDLCFVHCGLSFTTNFTPKLWFFRFSDEKLPFVCVLMRNIPSWMHAAFLNRWHCRITTYWCPVELQKCALQFLPTTTTNCCWWLLQTNCRFTIKCLQPI